MKLNLVPTHVAKERSSGAAIVFAVLLAVAGIVIAVLMMTISSGHLEAAKKDEADALGRAANAKATSDGADALMADKSVNMLVRDVELARAMQSHSTVYPDLYDKVRQYIPSYYRVISMAASPVSDTECSVTFTGTLTTYQEYADVGLALMRIPGAEHYQDGGYQVRDKYVPGLMEGSINGTPIRPGEESVPDDPTAKMQYLTRQGTLTGYQGVGGFGDSSVTTKGATPTESLVTITVTLKSTPKFKVDLQTPDPRATLSAAATASGTSTTSAAGGASGAFGAPAPGTPAPPAAPPAATGSKAGGKANKDDE